MTNERRVGKDEIAKICGVSTRTIDRWRKAHSFPCLKIGTLSRYRVSDVEAWINEQDPSREHANATLAKTFSVES